MLVCRGMGSYPIGVGLEGFTLKKAVRRYSLETVEEGMRDGDAIRGIDGSDKLWG
jgi:hypothetical protein